MLEQMDRTVRSGREVEESLGVRCLGLLPPAVRAKQLSRQLSANAPPAFAHTLQAVSVTLQRWIGNKRPQRILVTSSIPGEESITIAAGIAQLTAQFDRRVLLIDLDTTGSSEVLNDLAPNDIPRLTDVLAGR